MTETHEQHIRALPRHLLARCLNTPLAIVPEKLDVILAVLTAPSYAVPSRARPEARQVEIVGRTAVIPVQGTLVHKSSWMSAESGLTSYQDLRADLAWAMGNQSIDRVLFDIDSPGGESVGLDDLADAILEARQSKDVVAFISGMGCSAAYEIACCASRVCASQSAMVGSIGVILRHCDVTEWDRANGLRYTEIHAGARKADLSPHRPLDPEAHRTLQDLVNSYYDLFVQKVVTGRGMDPSAVRATEARVYIGSAAVSVGLADEVTNLDRLLASPTSPPTSKARGGKPMPKSTIPATTDSAPAPAQEQAAEAKAPGVQAAAAVEQAAASQTPAEIRQAAILAERERITTIRSLARPGAEAIIEQAINEGMSPGDTAMAVIAAENQRGATHLAALRSGEATLAAAVPHVPTAPIERLTTKGQGATSTDPVQTEWDGNADLRAEFLDDISLYRKHLEIEGR